MFNQHEDRSDTLEPRGSFIRWQAITINQLGFSSNLILSLSIASLGFLSVTVFHIGADTSKGPRGWTFVLYVHSIVFLALSVGIAIWLAINRLRDFRATQKAARLREKKRPEHEIETYRILYERLGDATWCLFWWQLGTFGIGIALIAASVLIAILQA